MIPWIKVIQTKVVLSNGSNCEGFRYFYGPFGWKLPPLVLRIRGQWKPCFANSRMLKLAQFCCSLLSSSTPTLWSVPRKEKCTLDRSIWLASAYYKRKMQNKQDESGGSEYKHTKWHAPLIQQLYPCASHQCEVEDEVKGETSKRVGTVKGRDAVRRQAEVKNGLMKNIKKF